MAKYTSTTVRDLQSLPLRNEYVGLVILTEEGISTKYVRNYDFGHPGVIRAFHGEFGHVYLHTEVFARDYKPGRVSSESLTQVSCPPVSEFSEEDRANALRRNDLLGPWNAKRRKKKAKGNPVISVELDKKDRARIDFKLARKGLSSGDLVAD